MAEVHVVPAQFQHFPGAEKYEVKRHATVMARVYTNLAIATLTDACYATRSIYGEHGALLAEVPDWSSRIPAAIQLLDRGWGKPHQSHDVHIEANTGPDLSTLSVAQLTAMLARITAIEAAYQVAPAAEPPLP